MRRNKVGFPLQIGGGGEEEAAANTTGTVSYVADLRHVKLILLIWQMLLDPRQ